MERNFHSVMDVWQDLFRYSRGVSWLRILPVKFLEKLRRIATRSRADMIEDKRTAKALRNAIERRRQPAQYQLDCAMRLTHPYYKANSAVYNALTKLQRVYYRA